MKCFIFVLLFSAITIPSYSQKSETVNNSVKIDSLQKEIILLRAKIKQLQGELESEILENGYSIPVKKRYGFTALRFSENEYGYNVIDTIPTNDTIKIIDRATSCFKVVYKGRIGYIEISDIDITGYPALDLLRSYYLREYEKIESNYSTKSSSGGNVSVKGYYRKDGTYVRPHTRRSSGRRR